MYHFKTKKIVFYDLEMFCTWGKLSEEMQETIRIGAVLYDTEKHTFSFFNEYVRPKFHTRISRFCKKLTGIKQKDINQAKNFKQVFAQFLTWTKGMEDVTFVAWGNSDLRRIQHDFKHHQMSAKQLEQFESAHVNLQTSANLITLNDRSVEYVLNLFQGKFTGTKHNPKYDAFNTMKIYFLSKDRQHFSNLVSIQEHFFQTNRKTIEPFYAIANQLDHNYITSPTKLAKCQLKIASMLKNELMNELKNYVAHFKTKANSQFLRPMIRRLKKIRTRFGSIPASIFTEKLNLNEEILILNSFIRNLITLERKHTKGIAIQPIQPIFESFEAQLNCQLVA